MCTEAPLMQVKNVGHRWLNSFLFGDLDLELKESPVSGVKLFFISLRNALWMFHRNPACAEILWAECVVSFPWETPGPVEVLKVTCTEKPPDLLLHLPVRLRVITCCRIYCYSINLPMNPAHRFKQFFTYVLSTGTRMSPQEKRSRMTGMAMSPDYYTFLMPLWKPALLFPSGSYE